MFDYKSKAEIYRNQVINQLKQIQRWLTGKALLKEFGGKTKLVTIVLYHGRSGRANADVVTPGLGAATRATAKGRRVNYRDPNDTRRGDGTGASPTVEFTPDMWPFAAQCLTRQALRTRSYITSWFMHPGKSVA